MNPEHPAAEESYGGVILQSGEANQTQQVPDIRRVEAALRRARDRARLMLLFQRALLVGTGIVALVLLGVGVDYLLRLPGWLRGAGLAIAVALLILAVTRLLLPAWRFRPTLTSIALRVEKQRPELRGVLASAVEFAASDATSRRASSPIGEALSAMVVDRAVSAFDPAATGAAHSFRLLGRSAARFAVAAAVALAAAVASPQLLSIGLTRLLLPWVGAEWPRRTGVADVTLAEVHPRGAALPLRAAVTRAQGDLNAADVRAEYRLVSLDGRAGPTRTALLTAQGRNVPVPPGRGASAEQSGALYERLVETDASAVEYRFRTLDDETPWRRVLIVDPPAVIGARAVIQPPAYAAGVPAPAGTPAARTETDLGPGRDERAVAPPALAGSTVRLALLLNKPIPPPPADDSARKTWLAATLGKDAALASDLTIDTRGTEWALSWTLEQSVRLTPRLTDEHGIVSTDESAYRFEASPDREPQATITDPASDAAVLPTAVIDVSADARDDVALRALWVERQTLRPAGAKEPSGPGGAVEPASDEAVIARVETPGERSARVTATIDLAALSLKPGQEVWLTALAQDIYETAAGPRPPTRSATRKLRIISETELIEEIRQELAAVRQSAIRVDTQQGEMIEQTRVRGSDRRTRTGQSQITERLGRQQEAVTRLAERVRRNNLQDDRLTALLDDAARATRRAGQASSDAAGQLDRAAAEQRAGAEQPSRPDPDDAAALNETQAKSVEERQQAVRDELSALIEALDAGQDSWVARRQIEQLLRQQTDLRDRTRQASSAAGVNPEQLSPQQRGDIERIADKQRELAEQARKLTDELPERARQLKKNDPAAAAALEQAARRAQQSQTQRTMERAANQAQQNQTNDAARSQEQAIKDLRDMLQEMERGERSRQEQLRRQIASIVESLDALIVRQQQELDRLDAADQAGAGFAGLDGGMISLNRNTLGVLDQAREAGRELREVASLVARAGEAQIKAIDALRARSVDAAAARERETESLARLREARELAGKAEEQQSEAENARKRGELRKAYTDALARQQDARAQTAKLAEAGDLSRRDRAAARAVGEEQASIRSALAELLARTQEIADTKVFEYAHAQMDRSSGRAADRLRAGEPAPALPDQDRTISTLQGLIRSLQDDPRKQKEDQFAGNQQGAGGSSGQGQPPPLIPPVAQLVLLRELQAGLLRETKAIAAVEQPDPEALDLLGTQQSDLSELGKAIIDAMQRRNQDAPPDGVAPIKPPAGPAPAPAPRQPEPGAPS